MLDKEMREPLFDYLDDHFGKIRIIEEKNILKSRADVLGIVKGAIIGFEIKSDSDTYVRLNTQVKDYDRFCDYAYLVIGKSHLLHAGEHVPEHWGIICISDEVKMIREAKLCPKVKFTDQLGLLWRNEFTEILLNNHFPKYTSKNKKEIVKFLIEKVDNDLLREQMTDCLFERDYNIFDGAKKTVKKKSSSGKRRKRPPKPVGVTHVIMGRKRRRKK